MSFKFAFILLLLGGAVLIGGASVTGFFDAKPGKYDDFAQCLTDNGVKMFGAYWCPHCQNQKSMFGNSFSKVNYVECALSSGGQKPVCVQENIQSYPTWEFSDGSRRTGELSLQELSSITGCLL